MSLYIDYLSQIENRKREGLKPKPIEDGVLLKEIISQIKDPKNDHRKKSINFLIYNTIPGTTSAAFEKSKFLKEIILENIKVDEIKPLFAFELLSHMKGGPSIEVLLDLALSENKSIAFDAAEVLKTQVFLYEIDTNRLESAYREGNKIIGIGIERPDGSKEKIGCDVIILVIFMNRSYVGCYTSEIRCYIWVCRSINCSTLI